MTPASQSKPTGSSKSRTRSPGFSPPRNGNQRHETTHVLFTTKRRAGGGPAGERGTGGREAYRASSVRLTARSSVAKPRQTEQADVDAPTRMRSGRSRITGRKNFRADDVFGRAGADRKQAMFVLGSLRDVTLKVALQKWSIGCINRSEHFRLRIDLVV